MVTIHCFFGKDESFYKIHDLKFLAYKKIHSEYHNTLVVLA
jgi:hypothetical protein